MSFRELNSHEIHSQLPVNPLKCALKNHQILQSPGDAAHDAAKKEKAQIEAALTEVAPSWRGWLVGAEEDLGVSINGVSPIAGLIISRKILK
jgi:hypothetical protein